MLEAINLSKTFKVKIKKNRFSSKVKEVEAVKDVSLKIEAGKIVGLIGANGAGKTTTIKMMTSLLTPTKGKLLIDGVDGLKNKKKLRTEIGLISGGEKNLYWQLTGRENLEYFGALYGIPKAILKERIIKYTKIFELENYIDMPVETYSKGMKQRLQIIRGIINDPTIVFLDEPTIGLDVEVMKEMHAFIRILKKENRGILLTSHYMEEIEELCDEIYIIDRGKIICKGSPKEIIEAAKILCTVYISIDRHFEESVLEIWKSDIEKEIKCKVMIKENEIKTHIRKEFITSYIKLLSKYEIPIQDIRIESPKLEDAILKIVKERKSV